MTSSPKSRPLSEFRACPTAHRGLEKNDPVVPIKRAMWLLSAEAESFLIPREVVVEITSNLIEEFNSLIASNEEVRSLASCLLRIGRKWPFTVRGFCAQLLTQSWEIATAQSKYPRFAANRGVKLKIGGFEFTGKSELQSRLRHLLLSGITGATPERNSGGSGPKSAEVQAPVLVRHGMNQKDTGLLVSVLKHHPNAQAKLADARGFVVKEMAKSISGKAALAFHVIKKDGSEESFSYMKCLHAIPDPGLDPCRDRIGNLFTLLVQQFPNELTSHVVSKLASSDCSPRVNDEQASREKMSRSALETQATECYVKQLLNIADLLDIMKDDQSQDASKDSGKNSDPSKMTAEKAVDKTGKELQISLTGEAEHKLAVHLVLIDTVFEVIMKMDSFASGAREQEWLNQEYERWKAEVGASIASKYRKSRLNKQERAELEAELAALNLENFMKTQGGDLVHPLIKKVDIVMNHFCVWLQSHVKRHEGLLLTRKECRTSFSRISETLLARYQLNDDSDGSDGEGKRDGGEDESSSAGGYESSSEPSFLTSVGGGDVGTDSSRTSRPRSMSVDSEPDIEQTTQKTVKLEPSQRRRSEAEQEAKKKRMEEIDLKRIVPMNEAFFESWMHLFRTKVLDSDSYEYCPFLWLYIASRAPETLGLIFCHNFPRELVNDRIMPSESYRRNCLKWGASCAARMKHLPLEQILKFMRTELNACEKLQEGFFRLKLGAGPSGYASSRGISAIELAINMFIENLLYLVAFRLPDFRLADQKQMESLAKCVVQFYVILSQTATERDVLKRINNRVCLEVAKGLRPFLKTVHVENDPIVDFFKLVKSRGKSARHGVALPPMIFDPKITLRFSGRHFYHPDHYLTWEAVVEAREDCERMRAEGNLGLLKSANINLGRLDIPKNLIVRSQHGSFEDPGPATLEVIEVPETQDSVVPTQEQQCELQPSVMDMFAANSGADRVEGQWVHSEHKNVEEEAVLQVIPVETAGEGGSSVIDGGPPQARSEKAIVDIGECDGKDSGTGAHDNSVPVALDSLPFMTPSPPSVSGESSEEEESNTEGNRQHNQRKISEASSAAASSTSLKSRREKDEALKVFKPVKREESVDNVQAHVTDSSQRKSNADALVSSGQAGQDDVLDSISETSSRKSQKRRHAISSASSSSSSTIRKGALASADQGSPRVQPCGEAEAEVIDSGDNSQQITTERADVARPDIHDEGAVTTPLPTRLSFEGQRAGVSFFAKKSMDVLKRRKIVKEKDDDSAKVTIERPSMTQSSPPSGSMEDLPEVCDVCESVRKRTKSGETASQSSTATSGGEVQGSSSSVLGDEAMPMVVGQQSEEEVEILPVEGKATSFEPSSAMITATLERYMHQRKSSGTPRSQYSSLEVRTMMVEFLTSLKSFVTTTAEEAVSNVLSKGDHRDFSSNTAAPSRRLRRERTVILEWARAERKRERDNAALFAKWPKRQRIFEAVVNSTLVISEASNLQSSQSGQCSRARDEDNNRRIRKLSRDLWDAVDNNREQHVIAGRNQSLFSRMQGRNPVKSILKGASRDYEARGRKREDDSACSLDLANTACPDFLNFVFSPGMMANEQDFASNFDEDNMLLEVKDEDDGSQEKGWTAENNDGPDGGGAVQIEEYVKKLPSRFLHAKVDELMLGKSKRGHHSSLITPSTDYSLDDLDDDVVLIDGCDNSAKSPNRSTGEKRVKFRMTSNEFVTAMRKSDSIRRISRRKRSSGDYSK